VLHVEDAMKNALAVILFAVSAYAQDLTVVSTQSACGPMNAEFNVKARETHSIAQPEQGKALVYVIEDQKFTAVRAATIRVGLDGEWVGANRGNSYLFFSVDPGEHHLCGDWTSEWLPSGRLVSLANFTAEAGKIYYFRARTTGGPGAIGDRGLQAPDGAILDLDGVNSDEGKLLVASSSYSVSQSKK
jgi:hypothetical protein